MARLDELTPGVAVEGVVPGTSVRVVQVEWHGSSALTLTYTDGSGRPGQQVLFRSDEDRLEVQSAGRAWSFDADGDLFRLVSEAQRISLAYLFDPFLAVQTSNLDPLPHQITAVYDTLLTRQPLRYLLADDPGAGKTIMAGLLMKELIVRGDIERCLVVVPGSLVEQWQDELSRRFGLRFDILTRGEIEASVSGNPFDERPFLIARLDHLARREDLQAKLQAGPDWDLVVIDEAHKLSAHYYGVELKTTKRFKLGQLLASHCRHLLLMTATPHSGKDEEFQAFMSLIDPDRFEGKPRKGAGLEARDLMRRLVKEKLLKFDGTPLFPERRAYTVAYKLSDAEQELYEAVTAYVREEMNRAERLRAEGEGRRGLIVGFALTMLQRRVASSPEAIYQSLRRRRVRLEERLALAKRDQRQQRLQELLAPPEDSRLDEILDEDFDEDDLPEQELVELEQEVVDEATAARNLVELEAEIVSVKRLEESARRLRSVRSDRKWEELAGLLQGNAEMFDADGNRRKLIVFTEHRDTLNYLAQRLRDLLGSAEAVVAIHGGLSREERRRAQLAFINDKDVLVLVATDAAGEGINLQRAHLMVNYDLPWNPNRIEQRFGRVHRIGQTEVCHLWNLLAENTREGDVFHRLFTKLEEQRQALGDQVFDVLGESFRERPLRDLLIDAIRYGERADVRARLTQVVDRTVGESLREMVHQRALVSDVMSVGDVERVREEMERAEARRLQPHFIRDFFLRAFELLGGNARIREPGRYEVTHVPADLRTREREARLNGPLTRVYERITFERQLVIQPGRPLAELTAPGHPLLDVVVDVVTERYGSLLKQGAVLVDEGDTGETPHALVYLVHAIQDGRLDRAGNRRVVSKRFEFVSLDAEGHVDGAGWAPYLDYRPATSQELHLVRPVMDSEWVRDDIERRSLSHAIERLVPGHLEEVRRRTLERVERTTKAVRDRLTSEIRYWDHRANQLRQQEEAGKRPRLNSRLARERADDLERRLRAREVELEREKQLAALPPVVVGGALVIPAGLLARLRGERTMAPEAMKRETKRVELAAIAAAMASERAIGREPLEMPPNNRGYDIESRDPAGGLHFIEVKGRIEGATSVTVTRSEFGVGLNKADRFVLVLAEVPSHGEAHVRYLRKPFAEGESLPFGAISVNLDWRQLWDRGTTPN